MPKTLVPLPQITPPPNINSNNALLTNIERFAAYNPKERLVMQVWLRAKELANDTTAPLTNYDPATASNVMQLIQDAKTVTGNIPFGDIPRAALAIDWANCKSVYGALSSDADDLRNSPNIGLLSAMAEEDLVKILLYLRLEIGE